MKSLFRSHFHLWCFLTLFASPAFLHAELKMSSIFGDNMVLQRDMPLKIWGWDNPGQTVTVAIADQSVQGQAGKDGYWEVTLKPLSLKPHAQRFTVKGSSTKLFSNVLVGEVWLCSGQSNMEWPTGSANNSDLEAAAANFPEIRLITVPHVGVQEPRTDFTGEWEPCTPETVRDFTAVGYFFGRQLRQTLGVPIGLIDNSWGGSACEAWIRRDLLKEHGFTDILTRWEQTEATYDHDVAMEKYAETRAAWNEAAKRAKAEGKPVPQQPRFPSDPLKGQHRPANLYNGVLKPILGYGIRGAIWYQGETNAGRAYEYRSLFPLMVSSWRKEWGIGDFPFYWVQLADFKDEVAEPGDSDWAELREAQTLAMEALPNSGQAVIYDLGESHDIHPRDKQNVAMRLARWALAKDYGAKTLVYRSPQYKSMEKKGAKIVLTFDHVGGGLDTFDTRELKGFAIAGEDQVFHNADAKILPAAQGARPDRIEVWSDEVKAPVAVRYAWANNPIANVQNLEGLPLTPFRTDDFPMVTKPEEPAPAPAPATTAPAPPKKEPEPKPAEPAAAAKPNPAPEPKKAAEPAPPAAKKPEAAPEKEAKPEAAQ